MSKPGPKPLLLREDVRRKLVEALQLGATHDLACGYAGVSRAAFYNAMAKGRAGEEPYASMLAEVEGAEGRGSIQCLAVIRKAAVGGQWQAAAWVLERRYPRMYGRQAVEEAPPVADASTAVPGSPEYEANLLAELDKIPAHLLAEAQRRRAG